MTDGGSPDFESIYNRLGERLKSPAVYRSPFEKFKSANPDVDFYKLRTEMAFDGTVGTVINELDEALAIPDNGDNYKKTALHPPRLIRAVIDWKIENPADLVLADVQMALKVGLAAYEGNPEAQRLLQSLKERLVRNANILNSEVHQKQDLPTWMGTDPVKSYKMAQDLAFNHPLENMLLIALGHGGTAAGMDVFLRFKDLTQSPQSEFYVTRFSRNKKGDETPRLTEEEIQYLQDAGKDKFVVVFEEDSPTNRTLSRADEYFSNSIFPGKQVLARSNWPGKHNPNEIIESL